MTATAMRPVAAGRSLDNTVTFGTVNISILLTGEDTGGAFSLIESVMRPGTEPPYHVHEREDETFHILEGHVSVMVDGVVYECRAGETIFLPRGVPHTFRVRSEIVRASNFITPSGFEKYFLAVGKPAVSFDPPKDHVAAAQYYESIGRAAAECGVRLMAEQPLF